MIAAWFGGTAERNPDVGIWISRFKNGKWSKPVEVANGIRENGNGIPAGILSYIIHGKEILLFYKVGPSPSEWWGELIISDDNVISWSDHPGCRKIFMVRLKTSLYFSKTGIALSFQH